MSVNRDLLRSSVYSLSVLAADFQKQSSSSDQFSTNTAHVPFRPVSDDMRLLHHLSVLLSRGTRDEVNRVVAVTSTPFYTDGNVTISVCSSSPSSSTRVSPSNSSSAQEDVTGQPPKSTTDKEQRAFMPMEHAAALDPKVPEIVLSRNSEGKSVQGGDKIITLPGTGDTEDDVLDFEVPDAFFDYAVKSLRLLTQAAARRRSTSDKPPVTHAVKAFFIKACYPKIRQRLAKVTETYDLDELAKINPGEFGGSLGHQLVRVKRKVLQALLSEMQIEATVDGYLFDQTTVASWWEVVMYLLSNLSSLVFEDDASTIDEVMTTSSTLHLLLHTLPSSFWKSDILARHLRHCRQPRETPKSGDDAAETADYVQDEEENISELLLSNHDFKSGFTHESLFFFRTVDAVLAWTTASSYLLSSPVARSVTGIQLRVLDLPQTPIDYFNISVLVQHWTETGSWNPKVVEAVKERFTKKGNKTGLGACHCEAGLVADILDRSPQPVSGDEVTSIPLGVAKKCCPICYILIDEVKKLYGIAFDAPGAHSTYYPWRPPQSLKPPLLKRVEQRLLTVLSEMVTENEYLARSRTSSPSSAGNLTSDEDDDPEGNLVRKLRTRMARKE
ncbi:hypothetical protein B0H12DRAFT_1116396 [Mycena haematopus]|nr:hypothetical protein B0H12DRAFT_1116396 [Mycena haematopus]